MVEPHIGKPRNPIHPAEAAMKHKLKKMNLKFTQL